MAFHCLLLNMTTTTFSLSPKNTLLHNVLFRGDWAFFHNWSFRGAFVATQLYKTMMLALGRGLTIKWSLQWSARTVPLKEAKPLIDLQGTVRLGERYVVTVLPVWQMSVRWTVALIGRVLDEIPLLSPRKNGISNKLSGLHWIGLEDPLAPPNATLIYICFSRTISVGLFKETD